jgi:hypothetical protein
MLKAIIESGFIPMDSKCAMYDSSTGIHQMMTGDEYKPHYAREGEELELPEDFPEVTVSLSDNPTRGTYIFTNQPSSLTTEESDPYPIYLIKTNEKGRVLFYKKGPGLGYSDFKQFSDGSMAFFVVLNSGREGGGLDGFYVTTDRNFRTTGIYNVPGINRTTDSHEFYRLPNRNMMIISYDKRYVDLSEYGGSHHATVYSSSIHEFTPEGKLVWNWVGWEHFHITDAVAEAPEVHFDAWPPQHLDAVHGNSIALTPDGNILLSSRHLDEVTKINRRTGNIMWRMGGKYCKNNEFTFINDPYHGFSHQHNAHYIPNGDLLIFDNGNLHEPPLTRVLEYQVSDETRTARLVWSYDDNRLSYSRGSAKRLTNGNTVIGWGQVDYKGQAFTTEVRPDGSKALEMMLPEGQSTYRVYFVEK